MPEPTLKSHHRSAIRRRPIAQARTLITAALAVYATIGLSSAWAANTCTVASTAHVFGAYNTLTALPGTSTITVTCTHSTNPAHTFPYTIALTSGPGTYALRQMAGGGNTLTYNLYIDAAHTTVWGDGTAATSTVSGSIVVAAGTGRSGFQAQTVYGLITAPQNVVAASYATTAPITVTVTY
jgi:spore coat protein U-like protein